ncbi:MAG: enoyl-[acyl-carrier-protein] reductase FabL [Planctomycetota bacterium]
MKSKDTNINLKGKVALITGGSRGIGRAVACRLAESGAKIVINYFRDAESAEETLALVKKAGSSGHIVKANVADEDHLVRIFDLIGKEYGRLDILVSNAASGVLRPATDLTRKHWNWTMDINAGALIPLSREALKFFPKNEGVILAISSLGAVRAIKNYAAVGASKAALESLVRHLAMELAPRGVRVNAISSGVVDTDALKHFPNREEMLGHCASVTPAGRLVDPDDVADTALFMCSSLATMIHGHTLVVDGGYSILG